jgi:hypothetical protein
VSQSASTQYRYLPIHLPLTALPHIVLDCAIVHRTALFSSYRTYTCLPQIAINISAYCIHALERRRQPDVFTRFHHSLWYTTVTMTTVGYAVLLSSPQYTQQTVSPTYARAQLVLVTLGRVLWPIVHTLPPLCVVHKSHNTMTAVRYTTLQFPRHERPLFSTHTNLLGLRLNYCTVGVKNRVTMASHETSGAVGKLQLL